MQGLRAGTATDHLGDYISETGDLQNMEIERVEPPFDQSVDMHWSSICARFNGDDAYFFGQSPGMFAVSTLTMN